MEKKNETAAWMELEETLTEAFNQIDSINATIPRLDLEWKAEIVKEVVSLLETLAKKGEVELIEKALDFTRAFNKKNSVVITKRNKVFGFVEMAKEARKNINK